MTRQSTKHSGDRTKPAQQRINRAMSLATLSKLLQLNFSAGARLIVLGYESARYAPIGECAEQDIRAWLRLSQLQLGCAFQYVRAAEQGRDDGIATVHRIIAVCTRETATALAANWAYGPAQVEEIQDGQLSSLAGRLIENVEVGACRHSWTSSKFIKMPVLEIGGKLLWQTIR